MPERKILTDDEKAEIRRSYRLAKNKQEQIKILCDLYLQERDTILEVLGLKNMANPKSRKNAATHSEEVRQEALRLVNIEKLSHAEAGKRLGVKLGTISYWAHQHKKQSMEDTAMETNTGNEKKVNQPVFTPITERVIRQLISEGKAQRRYLLEVALMNDHDLKDHERLLKELLLAEKEFSKLVSHEEESV